MLHHQQEQQQPIQNQMNTKAKTGGGLADILGMAGNAIAPGIGGFLGKAVGGLFS